MIQEASEQDSASAQGAAALGTLAIVQSQGDAATGTAMPMQLMDEPAAREFVNSVSPYESIAAQRVRYNDYQTGSDATTEARVEPMFMSLCSRTTRESQKASRAYGALMEHLVRLPQADARVVQKIKEYRDLMLELERCRWMLRCEH
jgi:hypothetical protein